MMSNMKKHRHLMFYAYNLCQIIFQKCLYMVETPTSVRHPAGGKRLYRPDVGVSRKHLQR
jgi:hypothetical protein